jgi:hypothetical protein
MTHIADIPRPFYCYVRDEYLYDRTDHYGTFTPCLAYGLSAIPGRAWGVSVLLNNGSMVQHLPLHALSFNDHDTLVGHRHLLDQLQIWGCYGWEFTTHEYKALSEMPCRVYMKGEWENGRYLFTAAPYGDHYSMTPDQHKHFNFVHLECGAIAALPGNRMMMYDSSFVTIPDKRPDYITNTSVWHVENLDDPKPFDDVITPEGSL